MVLGYVKPSFYLVPTGWAELLVLRKVVMGFRKVGLSALDFKTLSKFERWKEVVPNVSPNFQNRV